MVTVSNFLNNHELTMAVMPVIAAWCGANHESTMEVMPWWCWCGGNAMLVMPWW